jgi:hypothetical protein
MTTKTGRGKAATKAAKATEAKAKAKAAKPAKAKQAPGAVPRGKRAVGSLAGIRRPPPGSTGSARRGGTGKSPPRRNPLDQWHEFARHAAKEDPAYDALAPGAWPPSWPPATYHLSAPKPKRLLFFTKDFLLKQWLQAGPLPGGLAAVVRSGLATANYCAFLKREARTLGLPVLFIGDCDPYDLTVYLSLLRGGDDLAKNDASAVPVHFLGIDDRWLALCANAFSPPEGGSDDFKLVMGEMSPVERRHLDALLKLAPEVERLVGPRCMQILAAGRKLELEGACSRSLYAEGFCQKLLHHVEHAVAKA